MSYLLLFHYQLYANPSGAENINPGIWFHIPDLKNLKDKFTQNWEVGRLSTCPHVDGKFVVHETFLELHSKMALQHSRVDGDFLKMAQCDLSSVI